MTLPPAEGLRIAVELARITSDQGSTAQRARELLTPLRRLVPYRAAAVHLLDPERHAFTPLVATGYDERTTAHMRTPAFYRDVELAGMTRPRPPMFTSDLRIPRSQFPTWTEFLEPAGLRQGIAVGLFDSTRQLGLVTMHTDRPYHTTEPVRDFLGLVAPAIANAVDPMRSITMLGRTVPYAMAGVIVTTGGAVCTLPGLPGHPQLAPGSALVAAAEAWMSTNAGPLTFLWPDRPGDNPDAHLQVSVLACTSEPPLHAAALVLLSPAGDMHGLTRRELEVLGLIVDGWPNSRIATTLFIAERTVAAHVEHILAKLDARTRTLAAVRALRLGVYVPGTRQSKPSEGHRLAASGRRA